MENGELVSGSLWVYAPNKGAPIFFAVAFLLSGLYHAYQCIHYRCWKITGILPWSATLFIAGFIMREIGTFHYDNLPVFISSTVLIYAAPPIYELCNYYVLSRLLHYIPYLSSIHPGRVISTFLGVSVIVETFTANGAAQSANLENKPNAITVGHILLKVALILQLVVIVFFLWVAARFHYNCVKSGLIAPGKTARRRVVPILLSLYLSSIFIGTRTIYRTVEYMGISSLPSKPADWVGYDVSTMSPMLRYEWFFYFFEATLMLCNTAMLNFRHPGKYLPEDVTIYLTPEGEEIKGQGWKDNRNLFMKVMDPFDFWGLASGQDKKDRWWEKIEVQSADVNEMAAKSV